MHDQHGIARRIAACLVLLFAVSFTSAGFAQPARSSAPAAQPEGPPKLPRIEPPPDPQSGFSSDTDSRGPWRRGPNSGPGMPEGGGRSGDWGMGRGSVMRDAMTSNAAALVQAVLQELKHVPRFEHYVRALMQVQSERRKILEEKRRVGRQPTPDAALYHRLVRSEDELTSRQAGIYSDIVRDAPIIRGEISKRRTEINKRLAELRPALPPEQGDDDPTSAAERAEVRSLSRILRAYYVVDQRLAGASKMPHPPSDWFRPMFQSLFSSDNDSTEMSSSPDALRRRLGQIRQEQEELRRRMQRLDHQIDDIGDRLDEIDPASDLMPAP